MQGGRLNFDIANRTILKIVFWVLGVLLAYRLIGRATHVLTLIFISFFLALALNPVVSWMTRHLKIASRGRATAVAYLLIVLILAGFFALITPPLVNQTRDFVRNAPSVVNSFQQQDTGLARFAKKHNLDQRLTQGAHDFASHYSNFGTTILNTTKRIIGAIVSTLVVIVMTFMMLVEGPGWLNLLLSNVPKKDRVRYREIAHRMSRTVSAFVLGQVILATVAATACGIALTIASQALHVSINPIALAGIVALFGLIPMIGNPISSITVILICLLNSGSLAIVMLVYFAVYYQIENLTLQPYIQSKQNELTPLLVFISAIMGISVAGIVGALAAIPVAGCVKILLEDRFDQRQLAKEAA